MALTAAGRACAILILCYIYNAKANYAIPQPSIQAFTPKGLRVSIPDAPNLTLFVFNGKINQKIESNEVGTLSGEILSPTNGRWVADLPDITLNKGDVINYHIFVSVDKTGYLLDNQEFTIGDLEEYVELPTGTGPPAQPQPTTCAPTFTKLRVGTACAGQTVFEEHFNFNSIRENIWQIEHYIPVEHPEIPFVSYQRSQVSVVNGNLRIAAELQQNQPGWSNAAIVGGSLDLFQGCTSSSSNACSVKAAGANIVPPVVSGRLTSKPGFAFTYGTISVRAKLPQGDWLYPEILLEPLIKKYGFGTLNYKSGVVKIAGARGNKELYWGRSYIGNKHLYAGPIIEESCRDALYDNKVTQKFWGDEFHVYSVRWTPERITMLVDDVELGHVEPKGTGLRDNLPMSCRVGDEPDQQRMAPFDDHFYITLGLAAGGFTEFPNNALTTGNRAKPWKNEASKAMLNFWNDHPTWNATWQHPELLVDYVKVVAL